MSNPLYDAAKIADEQFHAALVAQFGADKAGDMRYIQAKHNARTAEARQRFRAAMDALRQSWKIPAVTE